MNSKDQAGVENNIEKQKFRVRFGHRKLIANTLKIYTLQDLQKENVQILSKNIGFFLYLWDLGE